METAIILNLDASSVHGGFDLRENGERVSLEHAFRRGFVVSPSDSNIVLTLLGRWLAERSQNQM